MLEPELIKAEQEWAQEVVSNAKSILIRNKKVATGRLVNSIRYTVNSQGDIIFLYDEDGKWVTQGRRKGARFPPPASISRWVRQKGITGTNRQTGRPLTNTQLTFLISRAIARDGIKPLPFMKMAVKESIKKLGPKLAKVKARAVVQRLKKELSKP
jgi:hypothetical protein